MLLCFPLDDFMHCSPLEGFVHCSPLEDFLYCSTLEDFLHCSTLEDFMHCSQEFEIPRVVTCPTCAREGLKMLANFLNKTRVVTCKMLANFINKTRVVTLKMLANFLNKTRVVTCCSALRETLADLLNKTLANFLNKWKPAKKHCFANFGVVTCRSARLETLANFLNKWKLVKKHFFTNFLNKPAKIPLRLNTVRIAELALFPALDHLEGATIEVLPFSIISTLLTGSLPSNFDSSLLLEAFAS